VCNFLDAPDLVFPIPGQQASKGGDKGSNGTGSRAKGNGKARMVGDGEGDEDDSRVIYRHYATLYFV
jgi:AP-3 complex subunit sigma